MKTIEYKEKTPITAQEVTTAISLAQEAYSRGMVNLQEFTRTYGNGKNIKGCLEKITEYILENRTGSSSREFGFTALLEKEIRAQLLKDFEIRDN
jgi:hypothetical protein